MQWLWDGNAYLPSRNVLVKVWETESTGRQTSQKPISRGQFSLHPLIHKNCPTKIHTYHYLLENCKSKGQRPGSPGSQQNGHHRMITHDWCWRGTLTNRPLLRCGGEWTLLTGISRTGQRFLRKRNIESPDNRATAPLASKRTKTQCIKMHTPHSWQWHSLQKPGQKTTKNIHHERQGYRSLHTSHTKDYYSSPKRNGIMPFGDTWLDQQNIILREHNQRRKKYRMITLRGENSDLSRQEQLWKQKRLRRKKHHRVPQKRRCRSREFH